ncbi:hypothetical protein M3Y98_00489100 [Aphelenchoides besseyi]|nr:hypothetical protein M3Y98_00489100 [Aphelenchoides besseyi]
METGTVCHANSAEVNNFMCTTSGLDERFFVTYKCPDHFVVDTFYGTKKLIAFDWSAITTNKNRTRKQGKFYLRFLHFVDEKHVYGTIICFSANVVAIISGTFDSATCVLKFGRFFVLNGWYDHHLLIDETTKRGSILLRPSTPGPMKHMAINFDDNQLSLGGTTEVPFTLHFPMKLDNKLYGFRADDMVNAHQLVEFSLADGTQTVHNIEIGNRTSKYTAHTWCANKLLVAQFNKSAGTSSISGFDLVDLKWQETKLEVKGKVRNLSLVGSSLIVFAYVKKSRNAYENLYYRFPFG